MVVQEPLAISRDTAADRRLVDRFFSYVVRRDYGFAPNPFFGYCTLSTCKPVIRRTAVVGDWVVGTGTARHGRDGFLVYVMRVSEFMTFNAYWDDVRFQDKKPNLFGSMKMAFGDNIYYRNKSAAWHQLDSHHSYVNGRQNPHNIQHDTQTDRVIISDDFTYWGGAGPRIPSKYRSWKGVDICARRHHKSNFPSRLVSDFIDWYSSLSVKGYAGEPIDWSDSV